MTTSAGSIPRLTKKQLACLEEASCVELNDFMLAGTTEVDREQ